MSQAGETFFTVIGCMDGRCQEAVAVFGQDRFGAKYPDTITEAGLAGMLARDKIDQGLLDSLKNKIKISLENHHSKGILVFGHEECAGNPVDDEEHKQDVLAAASVIRSMVDDQEVSIVPLFISRTPHNDLSDWEAKEIHEDSSG